MKRFLVIDDEPGRCLMDRAVMPGAGIRAAIPKEKR